MGFYFKKSKDIEGLRFDFSKIGIGSEQNENHISINSKGIYYKKKWKKKMINKDQNINFTKKTSNIDNENIGNVVDSSSKELVNELNTKLKKISLKWFSLIFLCIPVEQDTVTLLFLTSLLIFTIIDKIRKNTIIFYEIEQSKEDTIQRFYDSFKDVMKSHKKWYIKSKINNYNIKLTYGGASTTIKQKDITIKYKTPPYIKTNVKSIYIPLGKQKLYFFPDRILIYKKRNMIGLEYNDLNVSVNEEEFIWTRAVRPFDSKVVGYTYAHVNKNGTPDRRFTNNPQVPILNFTKIHFYSNDILNEEILLSKPNVGEMLKMELDEMKHFNKEENKELEIESYSDIEQSEVDPLLMEAIDVVIQTGQASTSFIQRKFKIGYARAGRIIDQMEERGVITGYNGSKPREILMTKERLNALKQENRTDKLANKINHIKDVMQIMDDNNLGYRDFVMKYGNEEDSNNTTTEIFKFSMFAFISYIVNSNLQSMDYDIIKKYLGTDFGDTNIENEHIFNQVFKDYKNQKVDPIDWYCFYLQNDELLQNNLLMDQEEKIVDSLIEVYKEIGLRIAENDYSHEQRRKRYHQYLEHCNKKLNELKGQVEEKQEILNTGNNEIDNNETLDELMEELNRLIGLENVKQDVNSLINLMKVRKIREEKNIKQDPMSLHLVFSGNPGTGKTTVARLIAKIYHKMGILSKGVFIEADRGDLVGGYVGQTALKVKEVCNKAVGGVLFIDEAYALSNNKDTNDFGKEAIETLLKFMEDHRDNFIVIVAGYTNLMEEFLNSNPGLKSRFNKYIHFNDYTPDELLQIYKRLCKDSEIELSKEAEQYTKNFFEDRYNNRTENFANARDVRNFFEKTLVNQANRIAEDNIITNEELQIVELDDVTDIKIKM